MPAIYRARDITDASLLRDVLVDSGIAAHVRGGDLQSGVGELPAGGLVAVWVDDADAVAAREVVARWERGEFALPDEDDADTHVAANVVPVPRKSVPVVAFLAGGIIGGMLVWFGTHGPEQQDAIDHDGDGRTDERAFFSPRGLQRVEYDRNHDGRIDEIVRFQAGVADRAETDNDFDGRFETRTRYRFGTWADSETDRDGDGTPDYRMQANAGVLAREQWLDADGRVLKQVLYEHGFPRTEELDRDGDGTFEIRRPLDALAEATGGG